MKAYRVASGRRIEPFGDLARELYVAAATIAEWQANACAACGLDVVDVESIDRAVERPAIIFFDDIFFTEMALRQFVAAVMSSGDDVRLAMPDSAALRAVRVLDDESPSIDGAALFDVYFAKTDAKDLDVLRARAKPIALAMKERTASLRLPAVEDRTGEAPLTARIVAHVRHWLHVFRLSQLAIGVGIADRLRKRPGLMLRLRAMRKRDPWELGRKIKFIDPTARVHPTADVEASVIGPGCVVRAHAHVHRSVLGANVDIGDHARVVGCALAERVQVLRGSYFGTCSAMPGATLSNYKAQLSLFGRDVFLTTAALLIDAKLEGNVRVEHDGRLVELETPFLGACIGHRAKIGAHVTIQAGRTVPNGVTIVAPPGTFAAQLPSYPEGTLLTVREGRIVPISSSRKA